MPDFDFNYAIQNRGKRHDYFTSCLPWPQKGPSVNLPLGSSAPVKSGGNLVSNAIDLQSSAGGFPRLNLGATVPLNVTQASAVTRQVSFGISGPAVATIAQLDEAAVIMAGRIGKLSEGVEFGIYKKLGKYRNDETPTTLACKATQWGSVIMSNDPRVEDADAIGPYPLQAKSDKLFVPWLDDETSRQDMKLTVKAPVTVRGNNFYLATSRLVDSQKPAIEVFPLAFVS